MNLMPEEVLVKRLVVLLAQALAALSEGDCEESRGIRERS